MIIVLNNYKTTSGLAIAISGEKYTIRTNQKYYNAVYSGNGTFAYPENGEMKTTNIWNERIQDTKKNFAVFGEEPTSDTHDFIKKNRKLFINKSLKDKPEEKPLEKIYNKLLESSKPTFTSEYNTEETYKVKGQIKTRIVPTTPPLTFDKNESDYNPEQLKTISDRIKEKNPNQVLDTFR